MKVVMKELEKWCGEFAVRWNQPWSWEYYCLVKDAWINGFKRAREEAHLPNLGETLAEVEVGSNQIGQKVAHFEQPVEERLRADLSTHYKLSTLDVLVGTDGKMVFSGVIDG